MFSNVKAFIMKLTHIKMFFKLKKFFKSFRGVWGVKWQSLPLPLLGEGLLPAFPGYGREEQNDSLRSFLLLIFNKQNSQGCNTEKPCLKKQGASMATHFP